MCDFSCNYGASYIVNMIQGRHTTKSFTIHTSSSRMVHSSTASLSIPMKGLPTALPICIWKSQVDLMAHVAKRSTSGLNFFFRGDRKRRLLDIQRTGKGSFSVCILISALPSYLCFTDFTRHLPYRCGKGGGCVVPQKPASHCK